MMFRLYDFYQTMRKDGIIFCFSGPISQPIVEGIGETIKQKMELEDAGMNTTQKVFAIFVEQMQNVLNYSAEKITDESIKDGEMRLGVLIIGREVDRFYVLCGNKVQKEHVGFLRERLDAIRGMDKEQLKNLYREKRKAATGEGKGGGLGFIDMARKAGEPIAYNFVDVDEDHSFFSIKVII